MIDVKFIRENPELMRSTCVRRGAQVYADKLVAVEAETRSLKHSVETMRAERNKLSAECTTNPEAREKVKAILRARLKLKVYTRQPKTRGMTRSVTASLYGQKTSVRTTAGLEKATAIAATSQFSESTGDTGSLSMCADMHFRPSDVWIQ